MKTAVALLYALIIAGYPLASALAALAGMDNRSTSVAIRGATLGLALFVLGANLLRGSLYRGAAWLPLLTFWTLYAFRIALDTVYAPISLPMSGTEYVIWAFGTCFFPMLALMSDPGDEVLERAAAMSFWFCAVACVLALYVNYVQLSMGTSGAYTSGRLSTDALNAISLGHLGITLTLLALHFFRAQRWLGRAGLILLIVLGVFAALVSGSRGPVIALAAAVLFRVVLWARRQPLQRVMGGVALTVFTGWLLVLGAFAVEESLGFRIVSRFQTINDVRADPSSRQHFELLVDAQHEFLEHPLIGSALVETRASDYPHNVAVESFMATGIIGGLMFCVFLVWGVRGATRLSNDPASLWISLLLVQQLVAALTAGAIYFAGTMWCMSGACVAIAAARRRAALVSTGREVDSASPLDGLIPVTFGHESPSGS